jgi:membrane-associated phospholipid phosphatase
MLTNPGGRPPGTSAGLRPGSSVTGPGPRGIPPRRGALLPVRLRRPAALLVAGCAAVTALLALAVSHQARPDGLDAAVDTWIRDGLRGYQGPLHLMADLGDLIPVTLMIGALVTACLAARWWRGAVLAALAVPAAVALTEAVLKPFIGRSLDGYQSYPSGHATALFALAATCAVLLANPPRPRLPGAVRLLLVLGAALIAATVAVAVVVLRYHYFTDTVAGAAVGVGIVLLAALILDRARPAAPRRPHQG